MPWYRLMLPPGYEPELRLYDLCMRIRSRPDQDGTGAGSGGQVVARPTGHGGIEVRLTWDAVAVARDVLPNHLIEEVAPPDMAEGWKEYVGRGDMPQR